MPCERSIGTDTRRSELLFARPGQSDCVDWSTGPRTSDLQEEDVDYIPVAYSHYVESTGSETLVYLEGLQAVRYIGVSAAQWLGLTPSQVVGENLNSVLSSVMHCQKQE